MFDYILIVLFTYLLLLLERNATVNVGGERGAFCSIDLCKEKKLYAPFKYRPLVFWIASLFNVTSKKTKPLMVWAERYFYNIYLTNSEGLERYYIFKYALFLFMNTMFYLYITDLGMNGLVGVLILSVLVALTFIYDSLDYILEITFYTLFLIGILSGFHFMFFFVIALLASLNRESSIFLILIAFFYCEPISVSATILGFFIGFVIPRIMYRDTVDQYDAGYKSGFRFLVFNPIKNWKNSIWPPLKARFYGIESNFFFKYEGKQYNVEVEGGSIRTKTQELFLNRIFLGIGFVAFCFAVFIFRYSDVDPFFHILTWIFSVFIVCISIPADIREIRVYSPVFVILVPYLMS